MVAGRRWPSDEQNDFAVLRKNRICCQGLNGSAMA